MRFLKILGMVVALHVVLFTIFLLSPGCQSTPTSPAPTPGATEAAAPVSSLATVPIDERENWSSQPASSAAAPAPATGTPAPSSVSSTISSAPLGGTTGADGMRTVPSRPANPEMYVSTGDAAPRALNPPPTTHVIRAGDNLAKIAARYGTTTTALQKANPGIKPQSLRPGQVIKLPANITASGSPAASSTGATSAAPAGARYTVRQGDSLSVIAARNGTTVTALRQANNIRGDSIQVGQELVIPGGVPSSGAPSSTGTYTPAPAPTPSRISADASTTTFRHVVKTGEYLSTIAKRYDVTVQEIMTANSISDPRKVRAGQELIIPGYQGTGAVAAPAPRPAAPAAQPSTTPPAAEPAVEPAPAEPLPEPQPLIPADLGDAPPAVPVDSEPVPTP